MLQIGTKQTLTVVSKTDFGVYLGAPEEKVLLPKKEVPPDTETGDQIAVFIYRDSRDRIISTVRDPKLALHEIGRLRVVECTSIGAFLDWGLEKDLLLPFHEQTGPVKPGEEPLVAVYLDKSQRLCATMNVYPYLDALDLSHVPERLKPGHWTEGTIYETSGNFGAFVAVEDRYSGLVPRKECHEKLAPGQTVKVRITGIRDDGRLYLSFREKAYLQIEEDSRMIYELIRRSGGILPFSDQAAPHVIEKHTGLSKNAFKRAVGRLLREGKIEISKTEIRIK